MLLACMSHSHQKLCVLTLQTTTPVPVASSVSTGWIPMLLDAKVASPSLSIPLSSLWVTAAEDDDATLVLGASNNQPVPTQTAWYRGRRGLGIQSR
mmetsp:Transcript_12589/g.14506  ORF Transcript_12589/g.14506 Transcript_12589/m.14506 type:complete len:96 (-) Transcript_12589:1116-1403(-)